MHAVEQELIKVTGYKTQRNFTNRQDYLGSILNAVMKLTDDDFEALSDEAATWANAAVEAKNSKAEELPDFDEAVAPDDDDEAADDVEGGDDAEANDEASDDDPTDDNPEDDEPEADEPDEEPEEKPAKSKAKAKDKPKFKIPPKPAKTEKSEPVKPKRPRPLPEDAVLDKWGSIEGSLNSKAFSIFERGATMKEVKEELGGSTFYNILKAAVEKGHKLEKEGHILKLTHKDANKATKPVLKKKK